MAIKFSVVQQKYDITGQNILKFFAKAQSSGETDFASICETISDRGTVTKGDVMASIGQLMEWQYTLRPDRKPLHGPTRRLPFPALR